MRSIVVLLVVLAGLAVATSAQPIYPVHQERTVDVAARAPSWDPNGVADGSAAPDMEPWLEYLSLSASASDEDYYDGIIRASADQLSEISGTLLSAYGSTVIEEQGRGVLDGTGQARYRVRFAVAAPTVMQLSGGIAAAIDGWFWYDGPLEAEVSVKVRQIAGAVIFDESIHLLLIEWSVNISESRPLGFVAELQPGVYELEIFARTRADYVHGSEYDSSWYEAEVSYVMDAEFVPVEGLVDCEASDIDGDTDVDLLDLYQLQHCFDGPH